MAQLFTAAPAFVASARSVRAALVVTASRNRSCDLRCAGHDSNPPFAGAGFIG
jgi:hypothetical protein